MAIIKSKILQLQNLVLAEDGLVVAGMSVVIPIAVEEGLQFILVVGVAQVGVA